jgi:cyclic beta-1,2-glucan synthetase
VRGDWQVLFCLLPVMPTRHGLERTRLPLISRWKVLDNLRRSLWRRRCSRCWSPRGCGCRIRRSAGRWPRWPRSPFPFVPPLVHLMFGPRPLQPVKVFLHDVGSELKDAGARVLLQVTLLPTRPPRWSTPSWCR